jgi:hypothetical protein
MKGTEERDIMFGRLFNYLALIRAGRIIEDEPTALYLLDRLIELHKRKGWIREVVSETILLLFEAMPRTDTLLISARNKLKFILENDDLDETPAHDLILLSGLQSFVSSLPSKTSTVFDEILPKDLIFSAENFSVIENTLLNACHGFPKVTNFSSLPVVRSLIVFSLQIHRVWTSLTFAIFGCSKGRTAPTQRYPSLFPLSVSLFVVLPPPPLTLSNRKKLEF